jgi:hypothetical protein
MAYKFGDEFTGSAAAMQLLELTGIRMRNGHGLVLRLQVVLKPGSQTGPPMPNRGSKQRTASTGYTIAPPRDLHH